MHKLNKLVAVVIGIVSLVAGYGGAYAAHHTFLKPVQANQTNVVATKTTLADSTSHIDGLKGEKVGPCDTSVNCLPVVKAALTQLQTIVDSINNGHFTDTPGAYRVDKKSETIHTVSAPTDGSDMFTKTLPDGSEETQVTTSFDTTAISELQKNGWFKEILSTPDGLGLEFHQGNDSIAEYGDMISFSTLLVKYTYTGGFCKPDDTSLIVNYYKNDNPRSKETRIDNTHWYFSAPSGIATDPEAACIES